MAKKAGHISILLFAFIFLVGNLLNYPFYRFAIYHAKEEMRREILGIMPDEAHEASIELNLSTAEYERSLVDEGKELRINGEMYDIIKTEKVSGGKVKVTCFHDSKEGLLHAWMEKVTNQHSDQYPGASGKNGKLVKLAITSDYLPAESRQFPDLISGSAQFYASPYDAGLCAGYQDLHKLPPRA